MRNAVPRIVIVDPYPTSRETLKSILQGTDWVLVVAECGRYDAALETLTQTQPDGVIINLDDNPPLAFQLIKQSLPHLPKLAVIALASRPELLVQAHRHGAKALLDYPPQLEDLSAALKNLSTGRSLNRPIRANTIAILSARGGVGSTTIAVNLGCVLAANTDHQVTLVDLDLLQGSADVALDVLPEYCLSDLIVHIDQLDLHLLLGVLTKHDSGLHLLARPRQMQEITELTPEQARRMFMLLRIISSHLLFDLSKGWLVTDLTAMDLADHILLVLKPNIVSIRNAALIIASLAAEKLDDKIRIIVNQVGGTEDEEISVSKIEETLGRPVFWFLPYDVKTVSGAWNAGIPLILYAPRSKIHQSIVGLAAALDRPVESLQSKPTGKPNLSPATVQELRSLK
ncbi:MAG: AAA family ATPase [Gemmataceae bacterium]